MAGQVVTSTYSSSNVWDGAILNAIS